MISLKTRIFLLITIISVLLPNAAFANGLYSSRQSTSSGYKQANVFFKMPDYMYANAHSGGSTATIPTIFFNIESTGPYNSMDIGLRYYGGGWGIEYFDTSTVRSGANLTFEVPGKATETHVVNSGDGYASTTYGHSDPIFNYVANEVLQLNAYFVNRSTVTNDWVLRFEVYTNAGTLKVRTDIPVTTDYAQQINSSGAQWTRIFALATNQDVSYYINDGSYAYNAQFQNGWLVGTNGTWNAWNDSIGTLYPKFEQGSTTSIVTGTSPYYNKISTYSNPVSSYHYDYVNIHYN